MDWRIFLRNGVMGEWSIGAMGIKEKNFNSLLHHSGTPLFQF
jgi:hypothetical protein